MAYYPNVAASGYLRPIIMHHLQQCLQYKNHNWFFATTGNVLYKTNDNTNQAGNRTAQIANIRTQYASYI